MREAEVCVVGCGDLPAARWVPCVHAASPRRENGTRRTAALSAEPFWFVLELPCSIGTTAALAINSDSKHAHEKMNSEVRLFLLCLGHKHA